MVNILKLLWGGRPDLAVEDLPKVSASTLLMVRGCGNVVIVLNEKTCQKLPCERKLKIIPKATHLFEESQKKGRRGRQFSGRRACSTFKIK